MNFKFFFFVLKILPEELLISTVSGIAQWDFSRPGDKGVVLLLYQYFGHNDFL